MNCKKMNRKIFFLIVLTFICQKKLTAQVIVPQFVENSENHELYIDIPISKGFKVAKFGSLNTVENWTAYYEYIQKVNNKIKLLKAEYLEFSNENLKELRESKKNRFIGVKLRNGNIYNGYFLNKPNWNFDFITLDGVICQLPSNTIVKIIEYYNIED